MCPVESLPTLFLSHGSPMHAIEPGWIGAAWAALGRRIGKPRSILITSAHWETDAPMLTGHLRPPTIHDFGGFPRELYAIRYPAPGSIELAERAQLLLRDAGLECTTSAERGLDHGAWVPLLHLYPDADVPVVQLSIQSHLPATHALRVGNALAPLANEGVLIVGSGHLTHNLREWFGTARSTGMRPIRTEPDRYVAQFTAWIAASLSGTQGTLGTWLESAPHARRAHPSPEHFLPLPIAFAAAGAGPNIEHLDYGTDARVLAMDGYLFTPRR